MLEPIYIYIYIYIYIFLGKQKVSRDQLTLPLKLSYSFYNIVYCLNRTFLSRSARKKFFWEQENVSSNWRKCFSWTWGHWIINLNYNPTLPPPPWQIHVHNRNTAKCVKYAQVNKDTWKIVIFISYYWFWKDKCLLCRKQWVADMVSTGTSGKMR